MTFCVGTKLEHGLMFLVVTTSRHSQGLVDELGAPATVRRIAADRVQEMFKKVDE